ncbi:MAG: ATP-binding protein [Bacteroidales bacterium]|nr:ATP-binding protein [Bacteroidales bacterium]
MESGRAEFVAIYGRRRVGKTFLVDSYFNCSYSFFTTGIIGGKRKEEMTVFYQSLKKAGFKGYKPKTWMDAFSSLSEVLESKKQEGKRRVLFFDELPCFATTGSGFVKALDWFWNTWASKQPDIFMVVCGSATSWIVKNIINNKGGLHNRITHEIHLNPFTLAETSAYLEAEGFVWDEISIIQTYMTLGGIPYYLGLLRPDMSVAQNIDRLFFAPNAELKMEYDRLYKSLFKTPEKYMAIIDLLATNSKTGMTRGEISTALDAESSGHLSERLEDLVNCDFIRLYNIKDKKISSSNGIYQLVDFYSIFYHAFGKNTTTDAAYWTKITKSHKQSIWWGLAYERLCMAHIPQILSALGVESVHTEYYSWRSKDEENPGAQVDLIIERDDRIINLCEIKYTSSEEYELDADERQKIANRLACFKKNTRTKFGIIPTLITTYGLKKNKHSGFFPQVVTMYDLMK